MGTGRARSRSGQCLGSPRHRNPVQVLSSHSAPNAQRPLRGSARFLVRKQRAAWWWTFRPRPTWGPGLGLQGRGASATEPSLSCGNAPSGRTPPTRVPGVCGRWLGIPSRPASEVCPKGALRPRRINTPPKLPVAGGVALNARSRAEVHSGSSIAKAVRSPSSEELGFRSDDLVNPVSVAHSCERSTYR